MKASIALTLALTFSWVQSVPLSLNENVNLFRSGQSGGADEILYPVHLSFQNRSKPIRKCVGVRIAQSWAATAAECLDGTNVDLVVISVPTRQTMELVYTSWTNLEHVIHPNYDDKTKANNIGLLKTAFWIAPDPKVFPVLPEKSDQEKTFLWEPAIVPKLNKDERDLKRSIRTTKVTRPLWCKIAYFFKYSANNHICASGGFGKGLTKDEPGTPLLIKGPNGRNKLIGIASSITPWSTFLPFPMVFMQVQPVHAQWIQETIKYD